MKGILIAVLTMAILLVGGALYIIAYPYYTYNKIVNSNYKMSWFYLNKYSPDYISPSRPKEMSYQKIKNPETWQKFHFGDLLIPLPNPSKSPFYTIIPNLTYDKKNKLTQFSLAISSISGNEYTRIYSLPYGPFPDYLTDQKLFDLPVVRSAVTKNKSDQIWEDVFTKSISKWDIPLEEMAYNLYLLNFRSRFIGPKVKSFYLVKDSLKVIMEVETEDKDFKTEIVFEKRGGRLFSYMIQSRITDKGADRIRDHIIQNTEYLESTPTLTDIIYSEFKNLDYIKQTGPTGMLYLISAWSHNKSRVEVFERAILHLERGALSQWQKNKNSSKPEPNFKAPNILQLKPLYMFYYNRYGKFYSNIDVPGLDLSQNMMLIKNVSQEKRKKELDEFRESRQLKVKSKDLSVQEEFDRLIEKTKDKTKAREKTIRID